MEAWKLSPCLTCTRVRDPRECENKNCRLWRQWFSQSWDQTRNTPALQKQMQKRSIPTVNIGGTRYGLPHRVREYLQQDPCETCPLREALCTSACPARRDWMEARKETEYELENGIGGKTAAV